MSCAKKDIIYYRVSSVVALHNLARKESLNSIHVSMYYAFVNFMPWQNERKENNYDEKVNGKNWRILRFSTPLNPPCLTLAISY
jgi:hypothetical protein